jgi:hypothetical protein
VATRWISAAKALARAGRYASVLMTNVTRGRIRAHADFVICTYRDGTTRRYTGFDLSPEMWKDWHPNHVGGNRFFFRNYAEGLIIEAHGVKFDADQADPVLNPRVLQVRPRFGGPLQVRPLSKDEAAKLIGELPPTDSNPAMAPTVPQRRPVSDPDLKACVEAIARECPEQPSRDDVLAMVRERLGSDRSVTIRRVRNAVKNYAPQWVRGRGKPAGR